MLKYAAPIVANATRIEGSFSIFIEGVARSRSATRRRRPPRAASRCTSSRSCPARGSPTSSASSSRSKLAEPHRRQAARTCSAARRSQPAAAGQGHHDDTNAPSTSKSSTAASTTATSSSSSTTCPSARYGSVGFDQTLALVHRSPDASQMGRRQASPARPHRPGHRASPSPARSRKPNIDERAVGNFLTQAAQAAVGGAIGGELNKALDELFRRK